MLMFILEVFAMINKFFLVAGILYMFLGVLFIIMSCNL